MGDWRQLYRFGTLVIWPRGPAADLANQLRATHDPVSQRSCPAHITLTQPFLAAPDADAWAALEAIAAATSPFEVRVGPIEPFGSSAVLKFDVDPKPELLALRRALHDTGLFNLTLPFTEGFIPHMTIAEFGQRGPERARDLAHQLNEGLAPMTFRCDEIAFIRPDDSFCFHQQRGLALGR